VKEAARIQHLIKQLQESRLSRRGFIRAATVLGLSLGAAEALAGCTYSPEVAGGPTTTAPTPSATAGPPPTPGPTPTPTWFEVNDDFCPTHEIHLGNPGYTPIATYAPPPGNEQLVPTATPWFSRAMIWSCPACLQRFATQDELMQHILTGHAAKMPTAHRVDVPTYTPYLTDKLERFDQRNHVFSRAKWDTEYQALISQVTPRLWNITEDEMQQGRALVDGGIYTDETAGNYNVGHYGGYSGHLQGSKGIYSWDEPVAARQVPVKDRAEMSQRIKQVARLYGADLVGITPVKPVWIYSHYFDRETLAYGRLEMPLKYAIVMALEMDFSAIRRSPGYESSAATSTIYSKMAEVTSKLARYIRGLGYPAVPSGNDTAQNIPLAIDAGLGELGRLGLLLTPEFGARQRICKVFTDLPLEADKPIDFGIQKFCETCLHCAHVCPSQAIPRGERSLERTSMSNRPGIKRWHINVAKCYLFWVSNKGIDCSNCIAACPWSYPNRSWL